MARNFDGIDDHLEVGDVPALRFLGGSADKMSISVWVKIASKTAEKKVVAKWEDEPDETQRSYLLTIDTGDNDTPRFAVTNASGTVAITSATTNMVIGTWHHLAGTYDGANVRIYVDGLEEGSAALTGAIKSTTAVVRVGSGSGGPTVENPMHGDIGHLAAWDVALSPGEVQTLATGLSPLRINRANLTFYGPINGQSPGLDVVGSLPLTVTGTTVSEEPPIPNSIVCPG